jgi:hypothetical protein
MATKLLVSTTRTLDFEANLVFKIQLKKAAWRGESSFHLDKRTSLPHDLVLLEQALKVFTLKPICSVGSETVVWDLDGECIEIVRDGASVFIPVNLVASIERTNLLVL